MKDDWINMDELPQEMKEYLEAYGMTLVEKIPTDIPSNRVPLVADCLYRNCASAKSSLCTGEWKSDRKPFEKGCESDGDVPS